MSYELVFTEKPAAAFKIATALAEGKVSQQKKRGVPVYRFTRQGKDMVVACAVGHLYTLAEKSKSSWSYPTFDIEWKPAADVKKSSSYTRKFLSTIKSLAKEADSFTVATDFDVEGEVIGLNVLKYACRQKDGARMKFSTLTKPELVNSYNQKWTHIDWGQANAGLTRHELDWFYGINLSRALTASIKAAGRFKIISSGRVQGPALKIIVDREKEIQAFQPQPYWEIQLLGKVENGDLEAWHIKGKFWKKEQADKVMENTKGQQTATVKKIEKKQFNHLPPVPFDLTTLQTESYRCFRISPKETLAIAQELYLGGLISYPRTSSQKLPPAIGYKKILNQLVKQEDYQKLANQLLQKGSLRPRQGKNTDPAHPAVYPTGVASQLSGKKQKIYDLVVKRFMSVFAEPAKKQSMNVQVDCNQEIFLAKGTTTLKPGWYEFYAPYVKLDEKEVPVVQQNDEVQVKSIKSHQKETQPPKRYTPASIVRQLEKKNLGTKATRAQIIDTLFQRGYIEGKVIKPTQLGISAVEALTNYSPRILDEELTRHFETEMEEVRQRKKKKEEVLEEAKQVLVKILERFKQKEQEVGRQLLQATRETQRRKDTIGKCPNCQDGTLIKKKGKFGSFLACTNYPKCKTTFNFPEGVRFKSEGKLCEHCKHPVITLIRKGKKPQRVCINPECPGKAGQGNNETAKKCPKCEGKLVLRKSMYGQFYGCSNYPKCRYTEKINQEESQ